MVIDCTIGLTQGSNLATLPTDTLPAVFPLPAWLLEDGTDKPIEILFVDHALLQLTLASNYTGTTGQKSVSLFAEFTPHYSLPLLTKQTDQGDYLRKLCLLLDTVAAKYIPDALPVPKLSPLPAYSAGGFAWYASAGHAQITGVGTKWTQLQPSVAQGLLFKKRGDTKIYQVASIEDDTHLTLTEPYMLPQAFDLVLYSPDAFVYPQALLYHAGVLWRNLRPALGPVEEPIKTFNPAETYYPGEYVYASDASAKIYKQTGAGPVTGKPIDDTAYWSASNIDNVQTADWARADTWEYQIFTVLSPNLRLPILADTDSDKVLCLRYIFDTVLKRL